VIPLLLDCDPGQDDASALSVLNSLITQEQILVAKHAAILTDVGYMIHAHDGAAVAEVALAPWWRRRRLPGRRPDRRPRTRRRSARSR